MNIHVIYAYHFTIEKLAEEFKGQFKCLGGNTKRFITFPSLIENQKNGKAIQYKIRFVDSIRFMASSLSNLADNLAEGLHESKCKDCKSILEHMKTQDGLLTFKCVNCYKTYEKMKIYIRHSVIYISTVKEALTKFAYDLERSLVI